MWKYIQRGFRETFERGLYFGRNDVRVNRETKKTTYCGNNYYNTPALLNCYEKKRRNCGFGEGQDGPNGKNHNESYETQDSFDKLLGAFSCSGALALGWILSHPYNWWFKKRNVHPLNDRPCLIRLFSTVAFAQPTQQQLQPVKLSNKTVQNEISYGPITAEQAFNEAAGNFERVHNSILGEVENRKGVDLIQGPKKNNAKAIKYFLSASKRGYLPAFYNLAQCYEQGLGTMQNFHEAAKWYKKAAEGGHATAMYNLGVFYAHGWGGLEASNKKAREWLEAAALHGQEDALAALGKTKDNSVPPPPPDIPMDWGFTDPEGNLEDISNNPEDLYKLAQSYENSPCDDSSQPLLVLGLYKMASDLGHAEARSKYKILQAYNTVGLLAEYICRGSKPRGECLNHLKFPTVY